MRFFRKLFGINSGKKKELRSLTHPRDMVKGDLLKFKYLDIDDLSNKTFEVSQVNTYMYGNLFYPEFILKDDATNIIYMMLEEDDGEICVALSRKIRKSQISDIISPDDINAIKSKPVGLVVHVPSYPDALDDWLVNTYKKVDDNIKGVFIHGDHRDQEGNNNKRECFISHILEDGDGEHALELEIYSTGEVELSVTVYCDLNDIDEMWPCN